MKKAITIMLTLAAMLSCTQYDFNQELLPREDISLTEKGTLQFSYNPHTCQMSCNYTTNEYRVFNDNLSGWFILKCDEMPSYQEQELKADLSWTASSSTKEMEDLPFIVKKTDEEGKIWLWCHEKNIGIVIKNL